MVAACGDVVAPRSPGMDMPSLSMSRGGKKVKLQTADTARFSFVIDPARNTSVDLGEGNTLDIPAGSVCDPSLTKYGPGQWDKPCVAAHTAITVNVRAWLDNTGHPQTDFLPELRFVPTAQPTGWVTISFTDSQASHDQSLSILYCSTPQSKCVNESSKDPGLVTVRDPLTGTISRRIQHFSGYLVGAGDGRDGGDMGWSMQ
jgi:hypothetical protein